MSKNTDIERKNVIIQNTTIGQDIKHLIIKIIIIGICIFSLFTFVFGIFRNGNISMSPSISDGDLVLYYRLATDYVASDVAVIQYNNKLLTGRVVAVEGDTVDIQNGQLAINGAVQQETKVYGKTSVYTDGIKFPYIVGKQQVFILGDNRDGATDSRMFGNISIKDIKGKVITIVRRRNI